MPSEKTVKTFALTEEAVEILDSLVYATQRQQGQFISDLIVKHHAEIQLEQGQRTRTKKEIAGELGDLSDKLVRLALDLLAE
jgi:hypothetical protein